MSNSLMLEIVSHCHDSRPLFFVLEVEAVSSPRHTLKKATAGLFCSGWLRWSLYVLLFKSDVGQQTSLSLQEGKDGDSMIYGKGFYFIHQPYIE